jgi:sulfide:quinone oxidoreductase
MLSLIKKMFVKEKMKKLNDDLYVGTQISENDIQLMIDNGIKTIICNRPDQEGPGQTDYELIKNEAEKNNLKVDFIAFSPGQMTLENIKAFSSYLKDGPKPIFAYCLSGGRSIQIAKASYEYLDKNN